MNSTYRVVHFIPDPFSGARVPVGALVKSPGSTGIGVAKLRVALGKLVGSAREIAVIDQVVSSLFAAQDLSALPASTGPQAVLGPLLSIPKSVHDPVRWVEDFILTRQEPVARKRNERLNRQGAGLRFFSTYGVRKHVKEKFAPKDFWPRIPAALTQNLQPVSHWTEGANEILLMEPIVFADRGLERVQREVFARFSAYSQILSQVDLKATLLVYLVQGGDASQRRDVISGFRSLDRAATIDLEVESERQAFIEKVRTTSIAGQPTLPQSN